MLQMLNVLFAVYTNIFCSSSDLETLAQVIINELNKLKAWLDINKLSLNMSKTRVILFDKHETDLHLNTQLDRVSIELVDEIKFLGVIIDDKINWKSQIKHVKTKISRYITVLKKAKL